MRCEAPQYGSRMYGYSSAYLAILAVVSCIVLYKLFIRLRLSRAKHPSVRGHAKLSRRLARLVAYY